MPNAARFGHELTEIRDDSSRFARFSLTIVITRDISLKKIFGGSQILTILTQLSEEIPLYSLSLHAGKGCSV